MAGNEKIAEAILELAKSIDRHSATVYTCVVGIMANLRTLLDKYLISSDGGEVINDDNDFDEDINNDH